MTRPMLDDRPPSTRSRSTTPPRGRIGRSTQDLLTLEDRKGSFVVDQWAEVQGGSAANANRDSTQLIALLPGGVLPDEQPAELYPS